MIGNFGMISVTYVHRDWKKIVDYSLWFMATKFM